ncbi:hypothetical protein OSTOST_22376 [Ostertagia ostertagi]
MRIIAWGDYDRDYDDRSHRRGVGTGRNKRAEPSEEEEKEKIEQRDDDDDEWLFNVNPSTEHPDVEDMLESDGSVKENATHFKWVKIELNEEDQLAYIYLEFALITSQKLSTNLTVAISKVRYLLY